MADQGARDSTSKPCRGGAEPDQRTDPPVRSRWTPKPEQILILESIFNSGMVNPPKDETVRIRKLLEKFGAVGDANVFYWFQNRRSRSRRRQRQIQASLNGVVSGGGQPQQQQSLPPRGSGGIIHFDQNYNAPPPPSGSFLANSGLNYATNGMNSGMVGSSSSSIYGFGGNSDDFFTPEMQLQYDLNPNFCSNFQNYQPEVMTVFINGVATEVVGGAAVDVRGMFGGDFILLHSSGVAVEVNEYGLVVQGALQHGESYFLVPRCS